MKKNKIINSSDDCFQDLSCVVSSIEALIFASEGQISLDSIYNIYGAGSKKSDNTDLLKINTSVLDKNAVLDKKKKKEIILKAIDYIKKEFNDSSNHGIYLAVNNDNFSFKTKPEYYEVVSELLKVKPQKFSKSQLETLSIIAYRQPIIKSEIDNIRGVDSGGIIKFLLEKNLIKIAGRKNIVGKPLIYKTTDRFLEVFNLKTLDELPKADEIKSMAESSDNDKDQSLESDRESELPFS